MIGLGPSCINRICPFGMNPAQLSERLTLCAVGSSPRSGQARSIFDVIKNCGAFLGYWKPYCLTVLGAPKGTMAVDKLLGGGVEFTLRLLGHGEWGSGLSGVCLVTLNPKPLNPKP